MNIRYRVCHLVFKPGSAFILTYRSIVGQLGSFYFFRSKSRSRVVLCQLHFVIFKLDTRYVVNGYIRLVEFFIDDDIIRE